MSALNQVSKYVVETAITVYSRGRWVNDSVLRGSAVAMVSR
jgi:hypothetical protein